MTTITRGYMQPEASDTAGPCCTWPRAYNELSLPISPLHMGSIYLPEDMTADEWTNVMNYLEVVRKVTCWNDPSVEGEGRGEG